WHGRFFKTRSLAAKVVSAGKVRVNTVPISKPSRSVGLQDVLTFPQGKFVRVIKILAVGERRGPAPEARALYEDLAPPAVPKQDDAKILGRNPGHDRTGRPSKRDRRAIQRLEGTGRQD
ncbi:MAG: S4 domain-containing protein, partial [Pseudomonadota bacterium]